MERALSISSKMILILGALAVFSLQVSSVAAPQPSKHSKKKGKASATVQPIVCQSPKLKPIQSYLPVLSAHSVTLSWNASVPSPGYGKADGYCLYRSTQQGDAPLEKDCKKCTLVNQTPFPDTACIDDRVTDGPTYYYVVAAVNAGGLSRPSNETSASIQPDKPATSGLSQ